MAIQIDSLFLRGHGTHFNIWKSRMAAYNRRWYILSSIIGALGIALIGALLGIEEFIVMDLARNSTADNPDQNPCNFEVSTRKLGFFTGTDKTCTAAGEKLAEHWPMLCMGKYLPPVLDIRRILYNIQ